MTKRNEQTCSLWFCERPSYALGFCMTHYQNLRRHGDVIAPSETDQQVLRDMCDDLAQTAGEVLDALFAKYCPVCGAEPGSYHDTGCAAERLLHLALRVKSSKATASEEKAAIESA